MFWPRKKTIPLNLNLSDEQPMVRDATYCLNEMPDGLQGRKSSMFASQLLDHRLRYDATLKLLFSLFILSQSIAFRSRLFTDNNHINWQILSNIITNSSRIFHCRLVHVTNKIPYSRWGTIQYKKAKEKVTFEFSRYADYGLLILQTLTVN